MLSFLGGFSSATSMVIVAAIALSTMVSNHIVLPIWLRRAGRRRVDVGRRAHHRCCGRGGCRSRAILLLGYLYFRFSGGGAALAAIGLISFAGVAQILPAMIGGLFWRGATRVGAAVGLITRLRGLGLCAVPAVASATRCCRPRCWPTGRSASAGCGRRRCSGSTGLDPLLHAIFWSLGAEHAGLRRLVALILPDADGAAAGRRSSSTSSTIPRPRAAGRAAPPRPRICWSCRSACWARPRRRRCSRRGAGRRARPGYLPDPTPDFVETLEKRAVGLGRRGDGACDDRPDRRRLVGDGRGPDGGGRRGAADHGIFHPAGGANRPSLAAPRGRCARPTRS